MAQFKKPARPRSAVASNIEQALPPVPAIDDTPLQYALTIREAINQGMNGSMFADLVSMTNPELVQMGAGFTVQQIIEWFCETPAAAEVVRAIPNFQNFAAEFLNQARAMYPPAGGLQL